MKQKAESENIVLNALSTHIHAQTINVLNASFYLRSVGTREYLNLLTPCAHMTCAVESDLNKIFCTESLFPMKSWPFHTMYTQGQIHEKANRYTPISAHTLASRHSWCVWAFRIYRVQHICVERKNEKEKTFTSTPTRVAHEWRKIDIRPWNVLQSVTFVILSLNAMLVSRQCWFGYCSR